MSTTSRSPVRSAPGVTSSPGLSVPKVTVTSAQTASPATVPVSASTPLGRSTATTVAVPGLEEAFVKEYPLGRIGTTQDVADAALWLAGDECFMTGQVLQVNGGLTLRRNPSQREISASMKAHAAPKP